MEGLDPLLADNYHERKQPISKCADVAKRLGLRVFAIQNGGQCFGGADENTYKTYGSSEKCADGVGGSLANDVYKLWEIMYMYLESIGDEYTDFPVVLSRFPRVMNRSVTTSVS